jgi:hypothetical protein
MAAGTTARIQPAARGARPTSSGATAPTARAARIEGQKAHLHRSWCCPTRDDKGGGRARSLHLGRADGYGQRRLPGSLLREIRRECTSAGGTSRSGEPCRHASSIRSTSSSSESTPGPAPPLAGAGSRPTGRAGSRRCAARRGNAGWTSLSIRSPTYATDPGSGEPSSSSVRAKKAGSGLATPSASLIASTSASTRCARSSSSRSPAGWRRPRRGTWRAARSSAGARPDRGPRREATVRGLHRWQAQLPVVGAEDREDVAVLATALDHRPQCGQEGEPRDAELIGPDRPDPRLVDQRLPDVEADPSVASWTDARRRRGRRGRCDPAGPFGTEIARSA